MENVELWNNFSDCLDSCSVPKKRYYSEAQAESMAAYLQNKKGLWLRVYKCPDCNYYHLTKKGV